MPSLNDAQKERVGKQLAIIDKTISLILNAPTDAESEEDKKITKQIPGHELHKIDPHTGKHESDL